MCWRGGLSVVSMHLLMRRNVVVHHSCEYNLHEEVNRGALTGNPVSMPSETYQTRHIFFGWQRVTILIIVAQFQGGTLLLSVASKKLFLHSILDIIGWPLTDPLYSDVHHLYTKRFIVPRGSPVMATLCTASRSSGEQLAGGATVGPIRFIMFCDCSIWQQSYIS